MLLVFVTFAVCMSLSFPEGHGRARVSWNEPAASLLTKTSERCTNVATCFRCANKLFGLILCLNPNNTLVSLHVNGNNEVMLLLSSSQPMAAEVFSGDGRNYLLAFQKGVRNKVYQRYCKHWWLLKQHPTSQLKTALFWLWMSHFLTILDEI